MNSVSAESGPTPNFLLPLCISSSGPTILVHGMSWWENEEEQMAVIGWHPPQDYNEQLHLENGALGWDWGLQDKKKKKSSGEPLLQTVSSHTEWAESTSFCVLVREHCGVNSGWRREETVPFSGSRAEAELCCQANRTQITIIYFKH